ncbi:hypothetical protein H4S04_004074 [Coemansia sp. S16]|nr:hypothetical protein H4S04_004074 [Coemansia sp. S16]
MQSDKEDDFDVNRIIGRRISLSRGTEYLILWLTYTLADSSWEPSNLLTCSQKIEEFEERCYQLRVEQQGQADTLPVDLYEDHGLVTLVDEGHEYMADCDSGFEVPPEDFDFVGDGSVSNNYASGGQVRAASRDQTVGTTATHGWHRMRQHPEEAGQNIQWSDQGLSWEAPSAFIRRKEVELLTRFGNSQFAQERRNLGQELLSGLTNGKVGLNTGKVAAMSGSVNRASDSSDAGRWFNLNSSTLAPTGPDSLQPTLPAPPPPAAKALARHIVESDDEEINTRSSRSSSADSGQPLLHAVKRQRTGSPVSAALALTDGGVDSPLARRMAQLSTAKKVASVYVRHREGEVLELHPISRATSERIERERRLAIARLQRAVAAPAEPVAGRAGVVAHGRVARVAETPPATPVQAPPPVQRPAERKACSACQMGTQPDAWGCDECGLWFHRRCYLSLATRLGADSEYLSVLEDYDDDDKFVCRFCSLYSRRTPQEFLTWRGAASSNRVNMAGVDILVKWRGVSYRHLDWVPFLWLQAQPDMRQKSMALKVRVSNTPEPPRLEDTFSQDHLLPAAIIEVRPCAPAVAKERLAKMRKDPPAGVPEDAWTLHTTCESVRVVWRGLGASDATWEAPPNPNDAGPEYCAWYADYVAWQQSETVSLLKHLQLAKKSGAAEHVEYERQPEFIRGGTLYPYQMAGANWLWRKWNRRQSVILADEMGLGKTVQVIAFLLMIFHSTLPAQSSSESNLGTFPFLIVAPTTLISNWAQELRTWAPGLVVAQLSGRAADREVELEHTIFRHTPGSKRRDLRCHVVLASYEAVANQVGIRELTTGIAWQAIVYDEGHRLKNDQAKTYKALSVFNTRMRVVLTGTPVQNDLRELSNILSFIDPDNRALLSQIEQLFEDGSPPRLARVHSLIAKYFLRRTKSDVPCLVPAKHEVIVPVSMTRLQRELYRATLTKNVRLLQSIASALHRDHRPGSVERVGSKSLNNVLLEVRQIVSHPYLINNAEPKFDSKEETHAQLISAGGKLSFLHALLPELQRRGHRALVFTQFKRTLDVLEDYLAGEGIGCVRIDGDTPSRLRQTAVNQFNAPGSSLLVFLASTRTGGTGLNLTSADVVIIYDCDFNPQADIQAIARAHRIGQTKPVTVLKLVTENSAEERIVRRATRKLLLDHLVIGTMAAAEKSDAAQPPVAELSPADMEADLRCDARTLFDESVEVRDIVYDSQRVVALLDQCQAALAEEKKRLDASGPATKSPFGVARVWAMDRDGRLDDVANEPESSSETTTTPASGAAADVWARLLEQKSEVPADGDVEMADSEGGGPRLRARKQKVDYGVVAVAAEDGAAADAAADDDGDEAMDAKDDDDDYVDEPHTLDAAGMTVVQPNELVDVVRAHVKGIIDNYKASARMDSSRRPSNWDEQVRLAFKDLCFPPLAMDKVQSSPPILLFTMPTDLRLPRGAQLPPQPPLLHNYCALCRGPWHGTGYCPRICDPQLFYGVAKIKSIQGYWAHPFFHDFVSWYSFQYIWFVLGDPRGPNVNDHNISTYRSYVCSAESYRHDVRVERRRREEERLNGIVAEAGRRANHYNYYTREYSSLCDNTRVCGELAVDVSDNVGRCKPVRYTGFGPLELDGPLYTGILADLRGRGFYLPTDVAALGPEHLSALLVARSNLRTMCLRMRELGHACMNPRARGPLPPKLLQMATNARLFATHGLLIDRRIAELRALAPADVDTTTVAAAAAAAAAHSVEAVETLFSMDVDDESEISLNEEIIAPEPIIEEVVEVPEPAVVNVAPAETCSDSVVPIDGQFDYAPGVHGIRIAAGKLSQARSLIAAARDGGEEPALETKEALMAAICDARTINLRELLKAVSARPQLHGLLPMVRRLAEIQADPNSEELEITSTLQELVLRVKAYTRDTQNVLVPTTVDIPLADNLDTGALSSTTVSPPVEPAQLTVVSRPPSVPSVGASTVHSKTPNVASIPNTAPLQVNLVNITVPSLPSSTFIGTGSDAAQASLAMVAPSAVLPQRQQAPPLRAVKSNLPAKPNIASAPSRPGVEARSSTPSLPSTPAANSQQTLTAATLAAIVSYDMRQSPPQQVAIPTLSAPPVSAPQPLLVPDFSGGGGGGISDSRRSSLTPNIIGLVQSSSPLPLQSMQQPQMPMSAPYSGQTISISSSPVGSPPRQQQWQTQRAYQQPRMLGTSFSETQLHLTTTDPNTAISPLTAGATPYMANMRGPQPSQPPPIVRARPPPPPPVVRALPSYGDLAMDLAQGYLAMNQPMPLSVAQQVSANMQQQQGDLSSEQQMRTRADMQWRMQLLQQQQQLAMLARGFGQQQQQYFHSPTMTQLITPITGTREPSSSSSSYSEQPTLVDTYSRQIGPVGNASWQYPVMARPPMYLERLNAHLPTTDMACVICEDPVHSPANCPFARNVGYLNRRRLAVDEDAKLPPNFKGMMLTVIDDFMRKALNNQHG